MAILTSSPRCSSTFSPMLETRFWSVHPLIEAVTISIFTEREKVVLTVADNAGGIPEEIIHKIFDPFFTTKGPDRGTGVGLYMSKALLTTTWAGGLLCAISATALNS